MIRGQMFDQPLAAHRLAGLSAADLQHVPAGGGAAEVVVEGDDAVHLGPRHVERLRHQRDRRLVDIAETFLQRVQHRQHRAVEMGEARNDARRCVRVESGPLRHSRPRRPFRAVLSPQSLSHHPAAER